MNTQAGLGNENERGRLLALALRSSEAECRSILGELEAYISAQIAGEAYIQRFPLVAVHLDGCPACAEIYAGLYDIALAGEEAEVGSGVEWGEPRLDFLQPTGLAELRDTLSAALERVEGWLRLDLNASLLPELRPASVAVRSDSERYGEKILELDGDLLSDRKERIGLTVYRDGTNPALSLVEVRVQVEGRSWPALGNITVRLTLPARTVERQTDAWGVAPFEGIPIEQLDQLSIEVGMENN